MSTLTPVHSSLANNEAEFRSSDDAWYSVLLALDGEKLVVKYCTSDQEADDVFEAGQFKSLEQLEKLLGRFRPLSLQLQDKDCSKVVEGSHVCASHSYNGHDVRFYDAVVEHVTRNKHSVASGEEECLCSFILLWQHGPHAAKLVEKKVENICFVQPNVNLNSYLASFAEIARKKINFAAQKHVSFSDGVVAASNSSACRVQNGSPSIKDKSTFAQRLTQGKCAKRSPVKIQSDKGRICDLSESNRQDADVGGARDHHFTILLENLEKELSPSTIIDFIHQQTRITPQVYVFPSLSYELHTRGAIVLEFKKDFEVLYKFLNNPDHMVTSSSGRPWVVAKNFSQHELFRALGGTFKLTSQKKLQNRNAGISNELRVVRNGTKKYRTAKKLKDLYMEFTSHQEGLYKRLDLEERKILQATPAK